MIKVIFCFFAVLGKFKKYLSTQGFYDASIDTWYTMDLLTEIEEYDIKKLGVMK